MELRVGSVAALFLAQNPATITLGCNPSTNDRFCPDDPAMRSQMAAFLHRALTMDG